MPPLFCLLMNGKLNGHATKKDPVGVLDDGDRVSALMRPFYTALAKLAFDDSNDQYGLDVSFSLENEYVQTVINRLAKNVRGVTDTTKDQIAGLVGRQADEGWSNEQLARNIRQLGVDMSRSRSVTIARTESASGYTGGQLASFQASGVVSQTEWLIGPDSCDLCEGLSGQRADLGGEYAPGVVGPPMHPRCTCTLIPVID
jgi:SPP1 gp7 family putative phage head morphogenesis protein